MSSTCAEKRYGTLTVGDEPQRRRGTAPALSKAFPGVQVISGLDGATSSYIIKGTGNMQITTEDKGTIKASSMTAVTKNGLTRAHREEVKIQ